MSQPGESRGFFGWIFLLLFLALIAGVVIFGAYLLFTQYGQSIFTPAPPPMLPPENYTQVLEEQQANTITIASWNLQRFGTTKAGNEQLMDYYASKLSQYDIAVIQEVTDGTGYAWNKLCYKMVGYECKLSERRGNTTYKEQYGVLYRRTKVQLDSVVDQPALPGYQRPPYTLYFTTGNWSFKLTTIHTTPEAVHSELENLEIASIPESDHFSGDKIIIGDLNGDCQYYKNIVDFTMWSWEIPSGEDTTVGDTVCAYDRIIANPTAANRFINYGVMRDVTPGESDHYLIWGSFRDT